MLWRCSDICFKSMYQPNFLFHEGAAVWLLDQMFLISTFNFVNQL